MYRDLPILHIESAHLQIMLVTENHIVEITENSNQIEISSNQLFSNFLLAKDVTFTKSLPKKSDTLRCTVEIAEIYSHTFWQKFRESNAFTKKSLNS